jgi:hypothetical protein
MNEKEIKEIQVSAAFVVNFANVLVKLRMAERDLHGVSLQHMEVKAILDGLRLLRKGSQ